MATLTRKLANSNLGRQAAINTAKDKNDNTAPGTGPLTANTITRLNAMKTSYDAAITAHGNAKAAQTGGTPLKDGIIQLLRMFVSHFIQVFNLGVKRNKYPAAHRSFYQLNVNSDAVPNLDDENNVLLWGNRLVDGNAERLLAGGAAMANPDITEVQGALTNAETAFNNYSTLAENLDAAEESLATLNTEADKLIKRIWDEVETFYGEEEASSKRENARRWGVIYVGTAIATLTGLVKENGIGRPNTEVTLTKNDLTAITNAEGRYTLQTTVTGDIVLAVHGGPPDNPTGNQFVNIPEHNDDITINVADIIW